MRIQTILLGSLHFDGCIQHSEAVTWLRTPSWNWRVIWQGCARLLSQSWNLIVIFWWQLLLSRRLPYNFDFWMFEKSPRIAVNTGLTFQEFLDAKYDSYIGSLGALIEIGLVCYILVASLVGFYTTEKFRWVFTRNLKFTYSWLQMLIFICELATMKYLSCVRISTLSSSYIKFQMVDTSSEENSSNYDNSELCCCACNELFSPPPFCNFR